MRMSDPLGAGLDAKSEGHDPGATPTPRPDIPLLCGVDADRLIAFDAQRRIGARAFLADVFEVAAALPEARFAVNLCEDRYHFLVAFCAVALRGQVNLLPHSRAPNVVDEVMADHADSYCIGERAIEPPPRDHHRFSAHAEHATVPRDVPVLPADRVVAIGFTSGSSGRPKSNPKTWGSFAASTGFNASLVERLAGAGANLVATVPPQHMYGMETTVLLPLLGAFAVHVGRPFFPLDIARALAAAEAPRVLVSTPVHLRALLDSGVELPPLALVLSATAPLPAELARGLETAYRTCVLELFGSTETCVIGHRRTAFDATWRRFPGVEFEPSEDGTRVGAPWFVQPTLLQDVIDPLPGGFHLRGRSGDLLEIAGKRASLADLTRRLLAIPGVDDGVIFPADEPDAAGVRRLVALVVAPGIDAECILAALRESVDPVFLPRPLRRIARLPRNETGKLPRSALLALLRDDP